MEDLGRRLGLCRHRLAAEARSVADISRRALELKAGAQSMSEDLRRLDARVRRLNAALPAPSRPAPHAPAANRPDILLKAFPLVLLLCAALGYGIKSQALPAAPRPQLSPLQAAGSAPVDEDVLENSALLLVYEHRLPDGERTVLDLLAAREAALGPSPWDIECLSEERCTVAFNDGRTDDGRPLYEFDVDLASRIVTPSEQTRAAMGEVLLAQR